MPGRMKRCSSASSAVAVRRGSTTTTLPPRSRIARMPAAHVGRGHQAAVRDERVRAEHQQVVGAVDVGHRDARAPCRTSARPRPASASGRRCSRVKMFCVPSARSSARPVDERRQVVRVRVAEVDGDRVAAVLARGSARGRWSISCERLVPGRLDAARRRGATSGVRRRSGSSCSCLEPVPFGQMKPWLKTSSLVAADRDDVAAVASRPRARRWPRRAGRCGSAVAGHHRSALLACSSIQRRARDRASGSPRVVEQSRKTGVALAAVAALELGQRARAHAARSAWTGRRRATPRAAPSTTGGPSPKLATGALVGQSSAPQHTSGAEASAARDRGSSSAANRSPSPSRPGKTPVARRRAGARDRRSTQVGNGVARRSSGHEPAREAPRRASRPTGSGSSSSSSTGRGPARRACRRLSPARRAPRAPPSASVSSGGGARRVTSATSASTQRRDEAAGVAAVARVGRSVEAAAG